MTAKTMPPPTPRKMCATMPPTNEPARPRPIVARIPIGSGPGRASRASAPTTRPKSARKMMKPRPMLYLLRAQAFEQTRARGAVLVVGEDAAVVQLFEELQVMGRVLGRVVTREGHRRRGSRRRTLRRAGQGKRRADRVGIDARLAQSFPVLVDADAALREA